MASNGKPQFVKNIFLQQSKGGLAEAVDASVRQDKGRISSAHTGMPQPAPDAPNLRPQPVHPNGTRTPNGKVAKNRTVHLTLWVDPIVKAELQRLADQEGITVSATGAAFLKQALQNNVDMHYSALLEPIIKTAIHRAMQGISNRLAYLLARNSFSSEQTRAIVANILGRQSGITKEELNTILALTKQTAKGNLTRRNPELEKLIAAIKQWLDQEEQEPPN
jgi:hypothetical protein